MLKATTGSSILPSATEAGSAAALAVRKDLASINLAFVYSSVQYDTKMLIDAVSNELPGVPLIGNTSFTATITPDGLIASEDGFVGILAISDPDMTVGCAIEEKSGDARDAGRRVAEKALKAAGRTTSDPAPAYIHMVAPPGEEELYLKGITEVIGRVPLFGGSAADNAIAGEWLLYTDSLVTADGVAVAFFYTDQPFKNVFTGAYDETANVGIVTKVRDNRVLVEIDGVPAVKRYAQWTGQDPNALLGANLLVATILAPLGVKDRLGDLVAIRHPMNGNDDYSMNIGANLAEKTAVIQMSSDCDGLIASVPAAIALLDERLGRRPAAYHLVHCGGRLAGIGDRRDELAAAIVKAAGDVPFITEFTFGEYGFEDDGNNTTGGLMLSFSALC
ncbi:MAG: FIST C-terminal domain-containing protein [Coriobacteriales bacterium]|jgi:hypothetical protein|nr:FIST C-terminal domain-containing protein [Coriobacteriales bacterium]